VALNKEITKREQRISKLTRSREAWTAALEKLQSGKNWQSELQYWVEDSQTAQLGALQTSLGLLVGVAGPVADAIEVHRYNAAVFWNSAQNGRARLEEINLLLTESKFSPQKTEALQRAAAALRAASNTMATGMKSEAELAEGFKHLDNLSDGLLKSSEWIERGGSLKDKHDLLLATKLIQDIAVDVLKDAGLVKIQKRLLAGGLQGAAQGSKLANFAVDYGYHSTRFYLAWSNVHDILGQIDDQNALSAMMGQKIVETTDQIKNLKSEMHQVENARGNKTEGETILAEMKQKEIRDAYLAGEWFSQRTGIRASGEPILRDGNE
jgi:hypothetical protein